MGVRFYNLDLGAINFDSTGTAFLHPPSFTFVRFPAICQIFFLHIRVSLVMYLIFVVCSFREFHV